jgi:hypothetical protein
MSVELRQKYLQQITVRLVIFTGVLLLALGIWLYRINGLEVKPESSYLVLLVFYAGLLGGFVSIQQRLPSNSLAELKILSGSWVSITLMPINGGVFALVLLLIFTGHIIQGQLFPVFPDTIEIKDASSFYVWIKSAYPATGVDVAKLLFWSFVAGFSERFVPQIIKRTADEIDQDDDDKADDQEQTEEQTDTEETSEEEQKNE